MEPQVAVSKPYTLIADGKHQGFFCDVQKAIAVGRDKKFEIKSVLGTDYSFPIMVYRETAQGTEIVHEE